MTDKEANEILFPNMKAMSFEEGFLAYKKFYNQPIECSTVLNVEGYPPCYVHGFRLWVEDSVTGEPLEVDDDVLMGSYKRQLEGVDDGNYDF